MQAAKKTQPELEELSAQATEARRRGDYREAAEAYQQILRLRPDLVSAELDLGLMQFTLKDYSAAIHSFEAVLHENSISLPGNLFLGLSLLSQQKAQKAVPYLERARSLDSRNAEVLKALGQAYSTLREYAQANDRFYELTQLNTQSADAWYGLGVSYLALSREATKQLASIDSAFPYSRLLIAESMEQQARREDALKLYNNLATIAPPFPCYRATVGLGLVRLGAIDAAERLFKAELRDHPGCLAARLGLARVAIEHGSFLQAITSLEELWTLDHFFVEANLTSALAGLAPQKRNAFKVWTQNAWNAGKGGLSKALKDLLVVELEGSAPGQGEGGPIRMRANVRPVAKGAANPVLLFSLGRYSQCTETLRPRIKELTLTNLLVLARCGFYSGDYRTSFLSSGRAVKINPTNLESFYWRIRTSEKLASDALLRTSLLNPNSAKVYILLGDAYREGEHFMEAEREYQRAIQISPRDFAAHFGLAMALYQNFQIDQAEKELKTVMALRPADPDASYLMGRILVFRHDYDAARPLLLAGLGGNPNNIPHVYALLGKVDAAQGRLTEAQAELEKSLDADRDGSYHYQLAQVYKQLGKKQAAAAAMAKSKAIRKASEQRAASRLDLLQPSISEQ